MTCLIRLRPSSEIAPGLSALDTALSGEFSLGVSLVPAPAEQPTASDKITSTATRFIHLPMPFFQEPLNASSVVQTTISDNRSLIAITLQPNLTEVCNEALRFGVVPPVGDCRLDLGHGAQSAYVLTD
jgi:hypothetical protein